MDQTSGKIGLKEFVAIIILLVGTKLADNAPAIFYEELGNAAWISIIIISLMTILPIYFLTKVITLYPGKNLIDVTNHLLGKYLGFLVLFVLFILQIQSVISSSAVFTDIIGTMYFTNTPVLIIYLVLMTVATIGARKGVESIGSTAWITLFWIKASLLVVLFLTFIKGQVNFLYPIFGQGQWEIVKESTMSLSIFAEFFFIALIASKINSTKTYRKGIWIGFIFVVIEFVLALIGYVMLFDYKGVELINYPFHETIRYIKLGFVTNVESLFFPFWLIAAFIRISFGLYLCVLLFGGLFKVQSFEYVIPALATIIMFIGLIPEAPVFTLISYRVVFSAIVTPIIVLLPFILWSIAVFKGEFKK